MAGAGHGWNGAALGGAGLGWNGVGLAGAGWAGAGHGIGIAAAPVAVAAAPIAVAAPAINPWALSPVGPSGVVTGAGASGPSGVVTGAGAVGPSGIVNGRGAIGPTGPNGHGVSDNPLNIKYFKLISQFLTELNPKIRIKYRRFLQSFNISIT